MAPRGQKKRNRATSASASKRPDKKTKTGKPPDFSTPSELVTFEVGTGTDIETFSVHKEFACHYSPVLKAAFDGPFSEGKLKKYRLDDISPDAFRLLVQWLYTQKIDVSVQKYTDVDRNQHAQYGLDDESFSEWDTDEFAELTQEFYLVQLWVTADKLLIRGLQNIAMGELQKLEASLPGGRCFAPNWFSYAYEHTMDGSPLRSLIVDQSAYLLDFGAIKKTERFPYDMLYDMVRVYNGAVEVRSYEELENESEHEDSGDDNYPDESGESESEEEEDDNDPQTESPRKETYKLCRVWRKYLVPEDD